ncbi:hypothetical protein [Serratia liquefaciens]|uniref:hypothetical protein n=1 Tax=Serratia liquefaciens TaxID=614 RepID=UPI00301CB870
MAPRYYGLFVSYPIAQGRKHMDLLLIVGLLVLMLFSFYKHRKTAKRNSFFASKKSKKA